MTALPVSHSGAGTHRRSARARGCGLRLLRAAVLGGMRRSGHCGCRGAGRLCARARSSGALQQKERKITRVISHASLSRSTSVAQVP